MARYNYNKRPKEASYPRREQESFKRREPELKNKKGDMVFLNTKPKQMDYSLLITVLLLVMIGLVMVFSSSYHTALTKTTDGDPLHFIKRQAGMAALGVAAMLFMANFEYRQLKRFAPLIYIVSNIFLVMVLFLGEERGGAKRWLELGPIPGFQPSEIAKIAVILFLAYYIDKHKDILKTFAGFAKCMAIILLPVILIVIENLSTALVVAVVGTAVLFFASPKIWYFLAMGVPALVAMILAVTLPGFRYRLTRIQTWLDPFADATGDGFQVVQSLYAVASGGFFGLGLGQSRQKLGYIPEAYNDIIFSIICEELGLVGAAALILLFYAYVYKGITISLKCVDLFGALVASGISCMIAIQVIINIAVNTNAIPVTGMPLPFISYGGTSLLIMMGCSGILLNISKYARD